MSTLSCTRYSAEQTTLKGWGAVLVGWLARRDLDEAKAQGDVLRICTWLYPRGTG